MKKIACAALAAALGLALPANVHARVCLRYSQVNDTKARVMTLRLENSCAADMDCTMSWKVTCIGAAGRATTSFEEHEVVAAGATRSWDATAAACARDDGYEISTPRWSCAPVTPIP
jgi:hypothetical protein